MNNDSSIASITKSKFFLGQLSDETIDSPFLKNIQLDIIDFNVRFRNSLKSFRYLKTLNDLINIDFINFLMLPNCGQKSINDAKNEILSHLEHYNSQCYDFEMQQSNPKEASKIIFPFLKDFNEQINEKYDKLLLSRNLIELNFSTRFQNSVAQFPKLKTVEDLLAIHPSELVIFKNCGKTSIKDAQKILINYLNGNESICLSKNSNLTENIIENFQLIIKDERSLMIFLQYYNYFDSEKVSLENIANEYGLTRERIRQIINNVKRKILKNRYVFTFLVDTLKSFEYVFRIETFLEEMIVKNQLSKGNEKFLKSILKEFFNDTKEIKVDSEFIFTINQSVLREALNLIRKQIFERIKESKEGIEVNQMIQFLKENILFDKLQSDKILTFDTLTYISKKEKQFFVVDNKVYNEMMNQIYFGKYLFSNNRNNIVYWSLMYFHEPIHFKQLTEFINNNNCNHKDCPAGSVHSALQNSKYCHNAGSYGCYALKEQGYKKYKSATDSIVELLKLWGSLTENKIIFYLKFKYSEWNIKVCLRNNLNKLFIKIGNNLYDLKNPDL